MDVLLAGRPAQKGLPSKMSKTLKATWRKHHTILGNFFSLSVLQVATYLAPVITLPYLVRVLGPSRFGLVELAHAPVAVYLVILTDYGFNLRDGDLPVPERLEELSEIFSAVMLLKLLLTVASLIALEGRFLPYPSCEATGRSTFWRSAPSSGNACFRSGCSRASSG